MIIRRKALALTVSSLIVISGPLLAATPSLGGEMVSAASGGGTCQASLSGPQQSLKRITSANEVEEATKLFEEQLAVGSVVVRAEHRSLDISGIKVYQGTNKGTELRVVSVPLTGDYAKLSAVTLVFVNGRLDNYGETHLTRSPRDTFFIQTWRDGKAAKAEDTGIGWATDAELTSAISSQESGSGGLMQPYGWGEKVGCVAATLGVSWKLAALITAICGGACTTSATNPVSGGVCAACVGGYVSLGTASFGAIYACFTL